jgi:ADP-ribosylglycohydrolase
VRGASPSRVAAFEGATVGLAVVDTLGFPTEFRKRQDIIECFGPDGVTEFVAQLDPLDPRSSGYRKRSSGYRNKSSFRHL